MTMCAYCWRTGVIEFRSRVPDGAGLIIPTPTREQRDTVRAHAVLSYANEHLVPGVGEAGEDDDKAFAAVIAFRKHLLTLREFRALSSEDVP
jgi:hypothetical protein